MSAEVKQLKQQIATLRKEVAKQKKWIAEFSQFVSIQKTGRPRRASLHMRCWGITLCNPHQPSETQALFVGGKEGPYISLWGKDSKARMILKVEDDAASVALFGKDLKQAVDIGVLDDGCGQVGVLDKGDPRAVMKGSERGHGVVSVVHSDGKVRATMIGTEHEGGEFMAVTPDMKTGVKISAGAANGGVITVNRSNGKPGVILGCTEDFGSVIVQNAKGEILDHLPKRLPREKEAD